MKPRRASSWYAAFGVLSLVSCQLAPSPQAARRQGADSKALRVERGVIAQRLLLTGELEAVSAESLSVPRTPRWNIAVRWLAENGSSVRAGDPVVELDNSAFVGDLEDRKLALEQALADRDQQAARDERTTADKEFEVAKAEIVLEKAKLEAAVPLDALARRTHQERQLAFERARVGLEGARDALATQLAAAALERTLRQIAIDKAEREIQASERATLAVVLRAPRAGTVFISDHPGWGRRLEVGDHVWPGLAVARLPDLSELRVNAVLADVDDGRVLAAMAVTTLLDAYPEQRFAGVVSEISPVAEELFPGARRRFFRVRIQLERTDPALMRPGMSVRVEVPSAGAEPSLVAPRTSLVIASATAGGGALPEPTEWAMVRPGELVLGVDVRGKLEASVSDSLGPPILRNTWEFKLARIAPEGSTVQEGDVVMAFDATELERQLLEKRNGRDAGRSSIEKELSDTALTLRNDELAVAEAEAKLQKAALKLERPSDLSGTLELELARLDRKLAAIEVAHKERLLRANAADNAANLSALRSRFARAEQRVTELEREIPRMQVLAPRAGTVVYVQQQNGTKKQVGDGVWWGDRILKIAVLDQMFAKGEIDEVDISRVRAGLGVTLRLEAHPDVECRGSVVAIGRTVDRAAPDNPSRVVRLDMDVTTTDLLRPSPGMRFEGRIETERLEGRLLMPVAAVFPRDRGPVAYRRTLSGFETVEPTLGKRDRDQVEVLAGLSPGDEVSLRDLVEPPSSRP